jgi:peptide/nickel transport system ATP-binding protein
LLAAAPVPDPHEQRNRREERHALLLELGDEISEIKVGEEFHEMARPTEEPKDL